MGAVIHPNVRDEESDPEASGHFPPNHLEGQQSKMWLNQPINKGAGIVTFFKTVPLNKDVKCHKHLTRKVPAAGMQCYLVEMVLG